MWPTLNMPSSSICDHILLRTIDLLSNGALLDISLYPRLDEHLEWCAQIFIESVRQMSQAFNIRAMKRQAGQGIGNLDYAKPALKTYLLSAWQALNARTCAHSSHPAGAHHETGWIHFLHVNVDCLFDAHSLSVIRPYNPFSSTWKKREHMKFVIIMFIQSKGLRNII